MKKLDKYGLCLEEYANNKDIAKIYYERAIGKSPEMESSKALAKILKKYVNENDKVADIGCACGHYYYSLKKNTCLYIYYDIVQEVVWPGLLAGVMVHVPPFVHEPLHAAVGVGAASI